MQKKLRQRPVLKCAVGILVVSGLILLIGSSGEIWDGAADLTVEFVVVDEGTGKPVQGAEIAILSNGGFNADGDRLKSTRTEFEEFKLITDEAGAARYVCRKSMSHGQSSLLPFFSTFYVCLPYWIVTPQAPGYLASEPFRINEPKYYGKRVKRVAPGQARLIVPISLRKSP